VRADDHDRFRFDPSGDTQSLYKRAGCDARGRQDSLADPIGPGCFIAPTLSPGRSRRLCIIGVTDTGVGMDAEVRRRVFESYFTTKKPSRGSGLGLTIVYRIVAEHAGFIEATSEPGCGSTFHIYLPV
jgi:signal transduction histidine kinase